MDIKPPPNMTPLPQMQVIEQLGTTKNSLIDKIGQIVTATVIKTEQVPLDNKAAANPIKLPSQAESKSNQTELLQQLQQAEKKHFNALLRIGSKEVSVITEKALVAGSRIDLKVITGGQLQLLKTAPAQTNPPQPLIQASLKDILPHQQVYARLLNSLLSTPQQTRELLPAQVQKQIITLIKNLPRQQQVQQGEGLKTALKSNGIFLEGKLLQTAIARNPQLLIQKGPELSEGKNTGIIDGKSSGLADSKGGEFTRIKNSGLSELNRSLFVSHKSLATAPTKNLPALDILASTLGTSQGKTPATQSRQQLLSMIQNLIKQQGPTQTGATPKSTSQARTVPNTSAQGDFKADIARLVHSLTDSLPPATLHGSSPSLAGNPAPSSSPLPLDPGLLLRNLAQLLKQQTSTPSPASSDATQAGSQSSDQQLSLQQAILRQALSTLLRTQLHQLTSLQAQTNPVADNPVINHWVFELPVLNGEKVDTFNIEVSEEENADKQDDSNERQWKVMMGFELDNLGSLFVQLILISDTVSATIWAEQKKTLTHVKAELETLRDGLTELGVEVKQLDCHAGKPPDTSTRLEQQLIDIHT